MLSGCARFKPSGFFGDASPESSECVAVTILQVHNRYASGRGGEDTVVDRERDLLLSHGHVVDQYLVSNADCQPRNPLEALRLGWGCIWSARSYRGIRVRIRELKPDIVHVHNTFASLSPSVLWAINGAGVPGVMTVHNWRFTCVNGLLLRNGSPCEECVGHYPLGALRHRCSYRESFGISICIAAAQTVHHLIGTYRTQVKAFISLSKFSRSVLIRAGLRADRIFVKPNFAEDGAGFGPSDEVRPKQVVFVGQLTEAKGIDLLCEAWRQASPEGWKLVVVGDGPARLSLESRWGGCKDIEWQGRMDRLSTLGVIRRSRWLALPSRCYEGFPMVIAEALASGTPVIVPAHGGFPEIVAASQQGILIRPNSLTSLRASIQAATRFTESDWAQYSQRAREKYTECYTADANYTILMDIYHRAMGVTESTGPEGL